MLDAEGLVCTATTWTLLLIYRQLNKESICLCLRIYSLLTLVFLWNTSMTGGVTVTIIKWSALWQSKALNNDNLFRSSTGDFFLNIDHGGLPADGVVVLPWSCCLHIKIRLLLHNTRPHYVPLWGEKLRFEILSVSPMMSGSWKEVWQVSWQRNHRGGQKDHTGCPQQVTTVVLTLSFSCPYLSLWHV